MPQNHTYTPSAGNAYQSGIATSAFTASTTIRRGPAFEIVVPAAILIGPHEQAHLTMAWPVT